MFRRLFKQLKNVHGQIFIHTKYAKFSVECIAGFANDNIAGVSVAAD